MPAVTGDQASQVIWGAQGLTTSFADDSQNHGDLLTFGYSRVTFVVDLSTLGSLTTGSRVDTRIFYRHMATSAWIQYTWETTSVVAQVAATEVDLREWYFTLRSAATAQWSIDVPILGRALKVMLRVGVGTPGAAAASVSAYRWVA